MFEAFAKVSGRGVPITGTVVTLILSGLETLFHVTDLRYRTLGPLLQSRRSCPYDFCRNFAGLRHGSCRNRNYAVFSS